MTEGLENIYLNNLLPLKAEPPLRKGALLNFIGEQLICFLNLKPRQMPWLNFLSFVSFNVAVNIF